MREIRSHVHDPAHSLGVLLSSDKTCAHHCERGRPSQDILYIRLRSFEINVVYMRWIYIVSIVLSQTEDTGISDSIPRMNMPMVTNSTGACPELLLGAIVDPGRVYTAKNVS